MGEKWGERTKRARKSKAIESDSVKEPPDILGLPFEAVFGQRSTDEDEDSKKASMDDESGDQSEEVSTNHSRPFIYRAGKHLSGRSLPRRCRRGVSDPQPLVQP